MNQQRLKILFDKYQQGTLTPKEDAELNDWFHGLNLGGTELETYIAQSGGSENYIENRLEAFQAQVSQPKRIAKIARLRWAAAAASVILIAGAGLLYLQSHKKANNTQIAQNKLQDIAPGSNQATLTLANGQKILLSSAHSGTIASQGQTLITKTADGKVVYSKTPNTQANEVVYNTLTTKRGEQYPLVLSDGTKVMLNAASSITYPVTFNGKDRQVSITGEVEFEVVHNAAKPFKVLAKGLVTEDLGTEFNINAYDDEPSVKTTLVSGSIKITAPGKSAVQLKPGQQAIASNGGLKVIAVDADDAIAWKNGYFLFDHDNLSGIMRQVSRWYNVKIEFQNNELEQQTFSGTITRMSNVSKVLRRLEITKHVKFNINGDKITVAPYTP